MFGLPTTYESIVESFVRQFRPNKSWKCDYSECNKTFATQSRLDAHKRRRHAVQDITPREPIVSSTDARDQSTTAADDGQKQAMTTTSVSPLVTTSSPGSQSLDNISDEDLDTYMEIADTIPTVNIGQTLPPIISTSLADNKPCLNFKANTGHTSADNPLPTTGQTVFDLPPTHVCRIDGCGLEFAIEYTLIAHQRAVHKTTAPGVHFGYDTSDVGGGIDSVVSLRSGRKPRKRKPKTFYKCSECLQKFATKPDLKNHWRNKTVHSAGGSATATVDHRSAERFKRHGCPHDGCDQSFATKMALKVHRRYGRWATDKQYGCDGCTKSYNTKHRLDEHRLTVHSFMATTVADDRPVEPTTVLPVQSTIDPNNSDSNSGLKVMDVLPAPKFTAHTVPVRPIAGHKSKPLSDISSDENSCHEMDDNLPKVDPNSCPSGASVRPNV
ncbi:unnamed protein product [Medioppia subpectinata]|uniref:C2H2-type domain-containing protein n=1 Tax=Medioppia subpectinata TaxID=1979941 RepID=A0A7R9KUV8_9ACAR|nr:unnamed protein product [Medioppia subpectinata]CAG2110146.1 unnamed protein product [Medioppia subpectinata]